MSDVIVSTNNAICTGPQEIQIIPMMPVQTIIRIAHPYSVQLMLSMPGSVFHQLPYVKSLFFGKLDKCLIRTETWKHLEEKFKGALRLLLNDCSLNKQTLTCACNLQCPRLDKSVNDMSIL